MRLNYFSVIDSAAIAEAAVCYGTPIYLYDENHISKRCKDCLAMPNAFGMTVRYAMKANSGRALLRIISNAGLHIDASSLNEVIRAHLADIPYENIMLTTQEIYQGDRLQKLQELMRLGLKYNVCSLRQLHIMADFAAENNIELGLRVHPGIGTGESATRNTGDDYSCFGIHLSDVTEANKYAADRGLKFRHIHEHIGSGGDSEMWRRNIDLELSIIEEHFPDALSVSFGGGLKEARMPDEMPSDLELLGSYAKWRIEEFYHRTGRKLRMEIEPGTFIVANSGYALTRIVDKKATQRSNFIILDGGMEINSRPLLYGSRHPMYVVSADGKQVKSTEFDADEDGYRAVVAGKCCESGDCQTLNMEGATVPRAMAQPEIGDFLVIGGAGAYCSSMTPINYNSHTQAAEVLLRPNGELTLIRKKQTLEQMLVNEE